MVYIDCNYIEIGILSNKLRLHFTFMFTGCGGETADERDRTDAARCWQGGLPRSCLGLETYVWILLLFILIYLLSVDVLTTCLSDHMK